jgi:hypothetical protein
MGHERFCRISRSCRTRARERCRSCLAENPVGR